MVINMLKPLTGFEAIENIPTREKSRKKSKTMDGFVRAAIGDCADYDTLFSSLSREEVKKVTIFSSFFGEAHSRCR